MIFESVADGRLRSAALSRVGCGGLVPLPPHFPRSSIAARRAHAERVPAVVLQAGRPLHRPHRQSLLHVGDQVVAVAQIDDQVRTNLLIFSNIPII